MWGKTKWPNDMLGTVYILLTTVRGMGMGKMCFFNDRKGDYQMYNVIKNILVTILLQMPSKGFIFLHENLPYHFLLSIGILSDCFTFNLKLNLIDNLL